MSWLITSKQYIPAVIGEPFGGGFFAGYISHTADGNPTHALIVAPRATGATGTGYTLTTILQWKTTQTITTGTASPFDGAANTAAMVAAGIANHPAAQFCVDLNIGGFTDWYLPARFELDIAYENLKPTTASNDTSAGINDYSVPKRIANRTANSTLQTPVVAFRSTGSEPFVDSDHWSSTEQDAINAFGLRYSTGVNLVSRSKQSFFRVRAFRRIAL
jgi:hypothetical protein